MLHPIRIRRCFRATGLRDDGQVLVLFALMLTVICGFVGLSVDIGNAYYTKADIQKMADAAALAGAQELPDASAAIAKANAYLNSNGVTHCAGSCVTVNGTLDTITVKTERHVSYLFLPLLGFAGADPTATAAARLVHYNGGDGLVPWGLIASNNNNSTLLQNNCYLGQSGGQPQFKQGVNCTLKYGAGTNSGGDFGAVVLDSTGASAYGDDIANGSTQTFVVGDKIDAQTGNMVGPTQQSIAARFARPAPAGCSGNSASDVLRTNADGSVHIREGCERSARIIIIPVVDEINNPEKSTILGFAFMFLNGTNTNGGHANVTGQFVKFVTAIPGGVYVAGAGSAGSSTTLGLVQ